MDNYTLYLMHLKLKLLLHVGFVENCETGSQRLDAGLITVNVVALF